MVVPKNLLLNFQMNYQIQTVKNLLASEQDIFNLMDRLGDQIKAKPGEVSIKAVQSSWLAHETMSKIKDI